jgi:hypothetical protein
VNPDKLRSAAIDNDLIWLTNDQANPLWNEPVFSGKVLMGINPQADYNVQSFPPLTATRPSFSGGINAFNFHRMFWWSSIIENQLPIDWDLSLHKADGLPPLESFTRYMERLSRAGCCLNFAMRQNLSRVSTARSFEAILAGALLVQEAASDMDLYFVAGEHYLPFRTFGDLQSVVRFIETHSQEAEAVRRRGYEFALENYNDERLIGCWDSHLYC